MMTTMKKYLIISLMLLLASCGKDEPMTDLPEGEVSVRVVAAASGAFTRAGGDETVVADRCILEIYNADGTLYGDTRLLSAVDASGNFDFEPRLLTGRSYKLVFWADKSGATVDDDLYYDTSGGLRSIEPVVADFTTCDIAYDAFYASVDLTAGKAQTLNASLRRAVCRMNVKTESQSGFSGVYDVTASLVDIPARFDALTGDVSGSVSVVSTVAVDPASAGQLEWFAYLLAPETSEDRTVNFDLSAIPQSGGAPFSREFRNIPLQRNYRVNITVVGDESGS